MYDVLLNVVIPCLYTVILELKSLGLVLSLKTFAPLQSCLASMDDNEGAAAAARDPASLAAAPKDLHLAGAPLHDEAPGAAAAVGFNVLTFAATARAHCLDERNAATEAARQHDKLQRY